MIRERILRISIIPLIIVLLLTAYSSGMHIMTHSVRAGMLSPDPFYNAMAVSTDIVVAEFVAQRPFGEYRTEFEFIVHDRIFGNTADTIFVYSSNIPVTIGGVSSDAVQFATGTRYLLPLIKIMDIYSDVHDDGFVFTTNLILDLDNPSRSTIRHEPLSLHSRMNFNRRGLTSGRIISYVRTLPRTPFTTRNRVFITSDCLDDIITGSPYVLIVEVNNPSRLAGIAPSGERMPDDIYYTTVVEVLKGDMQVGDSLRIIFFADTVFPGETHIVSIAPSIPNSTNPHFLRFTSRHSLHSPDQLDEIISIITGNTRF